MKGWTIGKKLFGGVGTLSALLLVSSGLALFSASQIFGELQKTGTVVRHEKPKSSGKVVHMPVTEEAAPPPRPMPVSDAEARIPLEGTGTFRSF